MYFDYSLYIQGCLKWPIILLIFIIGLLIAMVLQFIRLMLLKKLFLCEAIKGLCCVGICIFLLCVNIGTLLHGGIQLLYERESDAIEMKGRISEIKKIEEYAFPNLRTEYGYGGGVELTINGIKCTAIVKGSLEVGDYVSVIYLPKSGYVLSISEIDPIE